MFIRYSQRHDNHCFESACKAYAYGYRFLLKTNKVLFMKGPLFEIIRASFDAKKLDDELFFKGAV